MKNLLLGLMVIFLPVVAHAGLVERYFDYGPTSTVTDVNLDGNFTNIINEVNGGLDGDNTDTPGGWRLLEILSSAPAAGNQGRVVFLTSNNTLNFDTGTSFITTAVLPNNQTFTGNNTFTGTATFDSTATFNGTTVLSGTANTIGNGGSDTLALNIPSGLSSSAMTWTLTGALTFSGTIADLGTVTTVNIDGGTIAIGGTTATGELIVNNASDDADGLGSQGTSGQALQSAGAGANPTWVDYFRLLSTTAMTGGASSGNITIAADKKYVVFLRMSGVVGGDTTLRLRFNADSTGTNYAWTNDEITMSTSPASTLSGDDSDGEIELGGISNGTNGQNCTIWFNAEDNNSDIHVFATCEGYDAGPALISRDVHGIYFNGGTLTSFIVDASSASPELTGNIKTYEFP